MLPTSSVLLQAGMELRVLHTAARGATWYGQWHYGFGRGGFNMTPQQASRAGHAGTMLAS